MGGKKATTTSSVSIPPEVLERYNSVNQQALAAAATPYQAFGKTAADYVAQMNAQQGAGISDINATAGSYQPYMTQATSATQAGMGPASEGIDRYMSPYIKNVADTTGAYMRQQQEQAQSGALGTAISSGAFGGDRAGIAAANLQQQNQMGYGKTMADIMNQGYTQALGASQADLARQLQGGSQLAGLGAQSQQLGLQGAQAKIAAGTMQQQTEQAGKDAMINQFMQEKGYPFQVAQFLANIATGTGTASGSATTTQTPRNWLGFASGGAVEGYADGGGVAGPRTYSQQGIGGEGYVPSANLPVGQLMIADPPQQGQNDKTEEIIKLITMAMGAARGGAIDQRHGYATDGGVFLPDIKGENETRGEMLARLFRPYQQFATKTLPTSALALGARAVSAVPEALSVGLAGAQMPQASDLMRSTAQSIQDFANRKSGEGLQYRGANQPEPLTGQAALNFARTTPEQDAAREAFMRQNMDLEPSRTAADGYTPSDYGTAMLRGPTAAGWTLGNQPRVTTMTPYGVAGRPDVPVGSMPSGRPDVVVAGRPDVPTGVMPAAPPSMFETPIGSMPAGQLNSLVAGRPDVSTGVMPAAAPSRLPPNEPTAAIGVSGAAVPVVASTMGGLGAGVSVPPAVDQNGVVGPAVAAPAVVQQPDDQAFADPFGYAVGFTLQSEGGFNPQDANGAPVNFGINQAYHPEVDVSKITQDQAREIYRRDYWEPINGDALAAKDPQLARAVFDTAVMSGVGTANDLLEKSGGDTQRFLQLRADYLSNLITKNPEKYGKYAKAWNNRTLGLGGPNMMTGFGETGIGAPDQGGVAGGLFNNGKPYEDRNMIGKFFYDPATGKLNPNAVMALLGGLARGAEAQTISPLGGILAGLGGGMETYKGLLKQQADIGLTQAQTGETQVKTTASRFVIGPDGMPMVIMPDNSRVDFYTFRDSPELQAQLGSAETAAIVKAAEDANVAKAASAPDAGIYNTQEVQNAYNTEEATLRSLQGDRTASNAIVTNIGNAAAAAGGNTRANTFMQLNAFADLNGNPAATQAGYAASARAAAVQAVNFASSVLGMEPISNMSESAAIIAKSKSILASTAAQQLDAETATALNVIMTSLPDIEQDPRASAKLMASVVQAQQRAIDLKNFTDGYIKGENGNRTLTAFDAEKVFNDKTAQLYEQEKPYLEALILTGGDPSKVDPTSGMTPMQLLTSGQLNPQETADVLAQLFPQGYPSHLVTTFSR